MKINKTKRIGEVVVVAEGELLEFDIVKGIFHDLLGYDIISKRRNKNNVVVLKGGHDKYSRVILVNSPTSTIDSLSEPKEFYDFLYKEVALKYSLNLFNDPTYILFDRDRKNNRLKVVSKLIDTLTQAQTDTDEQNGLLLLSYPSIEAFPISVHLDKSYMVRFDLGRSAKEYVQDNSLNVQNYDETAIKHAVAEFIDYLKYEKIISCDNEIADKTDIIGSEILKCQSARVAHGEKFCCATQLAEMLIDLGIIEL